MQFMRTTIKVWPDEGFWPPIFGMDWEFCYSQLWHCYAGL